MRLSVNDLEIEVRAGTVGDIPLLMSFIRSMAEYEKLQVTATEHILRESLFGEHPAACTLLAFVDGRPVAYAVYFFTFATMAGKRSLWLEDLFVTPDFRGKGIAATLMAYLADVAIQNKCGRFEWMVLEWNESAIGFYERLGAKALTEWRIHRLEEAQLPLVASKLAIAKGSG